MLWTKFAAGVFVLLAGCSANKDVLIYKHPLGLRYALQVKMPDGEACQRAAGRLNSDSSGDAKPAFDGQKSAECLSGPLDGWLPYSSALNSPEFGALSFFSATRSFCEDAPAVLGFGARTADCVAVHSGKEVDYSNSRNVLQMFSTWDGGLVGEVSFHSARSCMDLMVRQYGYRHQSGYYYECQIETETVALAGASLAVRLARKFHQSEVGAAFRPA